MKQLITLLIGCLLSLQSEAQQKRFQPDWGFSAGYIRYRTDDLSAGTYYSSLSWNEENELHGTNYVRRIVTYRCANLMLNFGAQVPVWNNGLFTAGLRFNAAMGGMFNAVEVSVKDNGESSSYAPDELLPLTSLTLDGSLQSYLNVDLSQVSNLNTKLNLYGGYRFLNAYENYGMPVIGLGYETEKYALTFYGYFTEVIYYREFSNGTKEKARSNFDFGALQLRYFIGKD